MKSPCQAFAPAKATGTESPFTPCTPLPRTQRGSGPIFTFTFLLFPFFCPFSWPSSVFCPLCYPLSALCYLVPLFYTSTHLLIYSFTSILNIENSTFDTFPERSRRIRYSIPSTLYAIRHTLLFFNQMRRGFLKNTSFLKTFFIPCRISTYAISPTA